MEGPPQAARRKVAGQPSRGFSLMELLIVVVMLGVLAAAGLPRINAITRKEKATRALQVIQADVERAFATAARLRKPVQIVFNNGNRSYQVIDETGGTVRLTRNLDRKGDFGVDAMTAFPTTVTIRPNGVAFDTLNVTVTAPGTIREMSMTRVGLIRRVQ